MQQNRAALVTSALEKGGLAQNISAPELREIYQATVIGPAEGFNFVERLADGWRWNDRTSQWSKPFTTRRSRWTNAAIDAIDARRSTLISAAGPSRVRALPDSAPSEVLQLGADSLTIGVKGEGVVRNGIALGERFREQVRLTVRIPGLDDFVMIPDFLVFKGFDANGRAVFSYLESKASINGLPSWETLTDNQKVFLDAWLQDPSSVQLIPSGTVWNGVPGKPGFADELAGLNDFFDPSQVIIEDVVLHPHLFNTVAAP